MFFTIEQPSPPTLTQALIDLAPGCSFACPGDDYEALVWPEQETDKPSEADAKKRLQELTEKWEAAEYQRLRIPQYPSIGDQLDALYHAGIFPDEMAAKIAAIKEKFPKPEKSA